MMVIVKAIRSVYEKDAEGMRSTVETMGTASSIMRSEVRKKAGLMSPREVVVVVVVVVVERGW